MKSLPALSLPILALALGPVPAAAAEAGTSLPGDLLSTALSNLAVAAAAILICIGGLYAYASLARFAPYHSWIYLYLVSLAGMTWALFLLVSGASVADAIFVLLTVAGLNVIVHFLRFDRVEITGSSQPQQAIAPFDF